MFAMHINSDLPVKKKHKMQTMVLLVTKWNILRENLERNTYLSPTEGINRARSSPSNPIKS